MKKIIGLIVSMVIILIPAQASFAYEKIEQAPLEFTIDENGNTNVKSARAATMTGVATLERMTGGVAWRVTSRSGNILTFGGSVEVFNTKGDWVDSKPIFVTGKGSSTVSGVLYFPKLKKGTYKAEFDGHGTTTKGVFFISGNVINHFTK